MPRACHTSRECKDRRTARRPCPLAPCARTPTRHRSDRGMSRGSHTTEETHAAHSTSAHALATRRGQCTHGYAAIAYLGIAAMDQTISRGVLEEERGRVCARSTNGRRHHCSMDADHRFCPPPVRRSIMSSSSGSHGSCYVTREAMRKRRGGERREQQWSSNGGGHSWWWQGIRRSQRRSPRWMGTWKAMEGHGRSADAPAPP